MKKFISIILSMILFSNFVFASSFGAVQAEILESTKKARADIIEKIGQDSYDIITEAKPKLITVYRQSNVIKVDFNNGNTGYFSCSLNKTKISLGEFKTSDKYYCYGQYAIRFNNSVLYNENPLSLQTDTSLNESHNCIRMRARDIQYLYETIDDNVNIIVTDNLISGSIVLSNMAFDNEDI